ncbi:acyltransferase [Psychrobacillus lasiicapitis]|uniref:Acyltransferase n=1 Tax=Psychrobacillus lasiicapitis TaxID=1636719 RepID=A0A544TBL5_9BACI|nr:acyltransferase [Psychrobacillus lasiicapitis]TQR14854.1 acyltransferase [Psychrobacillus lasiicapitis]GGA20465.1 hypothetical protein GCM10011384_07400 [Psychrobacillus lasiicapitis]
MTFKSLGIILAKFIGKVFYDKKYLTGKWFEGKDTGWNFVLKNFIWQKIFRFNSHIPFPVSPRIVIAKNENLIFHPDDINNFQSFGIYFQNYNGKIIIGKGTYIAPNVGLITSNHDPTNLKQHLPGKNVILGEKCWVGMNAVILPGVELGDKTTVAAGAVVTKSFIEGNCIIGGVPAKVIKRL